MYSPAKFGEMIGKSVKTLQRWDAEGILVAYRSPKNRRYYTHDQYLEYIGIKANEEKSSVIVYSRVSSVAQKPDLVNQVAALETFCTANGYTIDDWVSEIGSGLNYKRKKFNQLFLDIEMGKVSMLVIAHKDR
ncbi:IS607 family transposase, partial [Acinetobacter sp. B51(2017)]|uniref:IS607 family transposase n=1 Tax=Acinetobacter sp. B51(2017) TaxID=2060938 RepID=UPI000F0946A3